MRTEKTPLVNKLILLVLALILGCLVVLVMQQNAARTARLETPPPAENAEQQPASEPPEPVTYLPLTNRFTFRPATNSVRPAIGTVNFQSGRAQPETVGSAYLNPGDSTPAASEAPVTTMASYFSSTPFGSAAIAGRVWLAGTPPPETTLRLDRTCGKLHPKPITTRHYVVTQDGRLANVFVYLKDGLDNIRYPVSTNVPLLDNIGCLFEPYVLGLQTGQTFRIGNSDSFPHNVHATPHDNKEFNLTLTAKDAILEQSLPLPEVLVRVKCELHPWMFAYIGVVSHPFFAVTDQDGAFKFPAGLPAGRYTIAAYHLKAGESSQKITVREGEMKLVNFTLNAPVTH